MLRKQDTVLVAVSGGFDSTVLLLILNELKEQLDIKIHAAHLNHQLRGKESEEDERFVQKITSQLDTPLSVERKNVKALAKEGSSLEDTARRIRYDFLIKTANKIKAQKIATGHTRDDQAETFIMHMLRGSGLRGLSAIQPIRKINKKTVIRPLIDITKEEIKAYLKEKKIRARLDSSNLSTAFLRNRIRLNLIPLLERDFNPKIKNIFAKEAQSLQAAYSYIEKESQKKFNKVATVKRGKVKLNLKKLKRKDSAIKNHLLRLAIKKAKGNLNKISFEHIMSLNRLIKESTGTSKLDLPSNIQAVKEYNSLTIKKKKTSTTSALLPEKLEVPGITKIEDLGLKIKTEIVSKEQYHPKREKSMEYMDLANIKQPIILRFRKRSDKFKPLGMKEEKKLKDFFIDEKIPQDKRDRTLLAESKGKIIWVIGTRIADSVKVTKHTKELIKLNLINI